MNFFSQICALLSHISVFVQLKFENFLSQIGEFFSVNQNGKFLRYFGYNFGTFLSKVGTWWRVFWVSQNGTFLSWIGWLKLAKLAKLGEVFVLAVDPCDSFFYTTLNLWKLVHKYLRKNKNETTTSAKKHKLKCFR